MGAAGLWGLLWPAFQYGYLSVPLGEGRMLLSLWAFLPFAASLFLFTFYTWQAVRKHYATLPFVRSQLSGGGLMIFSYLLRPGSSLTISDYRNHKELQLINFLLWLLIVLTAIALLLAYRQWSKAGRHPSTGPANHSR